MPSMATARRSWAPDRVVGQLRLALGQQAASWRPRRARRPAGLAAGVATRTRPMTWRQTAGLVDCQGLVDGELGLPHAQTGAGVGLGIEIDHQHPPAGRGRGRGQTERDGRLADPTLLVHHGDGHHGAQT